MKHIQLIETILYVNDQQASTVFYTKLFRQNPDLNVPGMTEFNLTETCKLGLMPNKGIAKYFRTKRHIQNKETAYQDANYIFM